MAFADPLRFARAARRYVAVIHGLSTFLSRSNDKGRLRPSIASAFRQATFAAAAAD